MKLTMKLEAMDKFVEYLNSKNEERFSDLVSDMAWRRRYYSSDGTYEIDCDQYSVGELQIIRDGLSVIKARTLVKKLDAVLSVLQNPDTIEIKSLEAFPRAVSEYLKTKAPHKWIFRASSGDNYEELIPWFVFNITYIPRFFDSKTCYLEEEHCVMEIHTNTMKGFVKNIISFYPTDISNMTITDAFRHKNIYIENEEMYKQYVETNNVYESRVKEQCKQYKCYAYVENSSYSSYRRSIDKNDTTMSFYHVVNDSKSLLGYESGIRRVESCSFYAGEGKKDTWGKYSDEYELPVAPYLKCYNLDRYCDCFVHVNDIEDYEYDKSLREKLVLPGSHKALLDILVNNSSILKGDIINNKGNGTVVILEGPPGCGKTLTTEVYTELIEKPLYKISAGQLGSEAKEIEKNLYDVLNRAQRLNCILLIDECEIFVRKRGDDFNQNAIVTTFLRKIEYFDGIMFLTSNRINDIDEAILSRCIASIKYKAPDEENAKKIWKVLINQFELTESVTEGMIENLVQIFPKAVGRDIKELLKLTARYCQGNNKKITLQDFVDCAQFRYIDIDEEAIKSLGLHKT